MYEQATNGLTTAAADSDVGAPVERTAALKAEHQSLVIQVRQLEAEAAESHSRTAICVQTVQERRERLITLARGERQLLEELEFLEKELAEQEGGLAAAMVRLKDNLARVERLVRQVEFVKGELEALIQQVDICKGSIPDKVMGMQHTDGKILGTARELARLADRVRRTEKDLKLFYYDKKRELRRKHASY